MSETPVTTSTNEPTPLRDALRAAKARRDDALRAAAAAEEAWLDDDSTPPGASAEDSETGRASIAADDALEAAEAAVESAEIALWHSDEPRLYTVRDDHTEWTLESRPSTLDRDVHASIEEGDWDRSRTVWWDGKATGECGIAQKVTVTLPPLAPHCREGRQHDWQAPHAVVGGLRENPGVRGNGGGVLILEVCAHCGVYRLTNTWATNPTNGSQGHTAIEYIAADEDSIAWIAGQREDLEECADCEGSTEAGTPDPHVCHPR